ncbi:MAG: PEP-CTERM sorting domain-containing protein [Aquabacterium sp.]|nr:PEP-CTERM sorting domain-containing protein [Aquabacterium sp.]
MGIHRTTTIPEPSTWAMMSLGLVALVWRTRSC